MPINLTRGYSGWTAGTIAPKSNGAVHEQSPGLMAPAAKATAATPAAPPVNPLYAMLSQALGIPMPNAGPTNSTVPQSTYNSSMSVAQNPNIPSWLASAVANLNNYDAYSRTQAAAPGAGFDPLIGQTMAATEARLEAQQKAQKAADDAKVAQAKADAAANAHAQEVQVQHQKYISPIGQAGSGGWMSPPIF